MTEEKKLQKIVVLSLILGILGIYFSHFSDLRLLFYDLTAEYRATLTMSDEIELKEEYVFNVKEPKKYRMLYRFWEAPILYNENADYPFIKVTDVSSEFNWYIKDTNGNVFTNYKTEDKSLVEFIKNKGYKNEIGIINLNYFQTGKYKLNISYKIYPPLNTDQNYIHLNIKLADKHIPYEKVKIKIDDPYSYIFKLYPHMPDYKILKLSDGWLIESKVKRDGLIELEMLMLKTKIKGFYQNHPNVYKTTEESNTDKIGVFFSIFEKLLTISVGLFPVFLLIFYKFFSEEKKYTVPEFISFIPNEKRKPHTVNLIFNGDAFEGDENGFYATLLNLHLNKHIRIKPYDTDIEIEILNPEVNDPYEKKVINFLKRYTIDPDGRIFSSSLIENKIKNLLASRDLERVKMFKYELDTVFKYRNDYEASKFLDKTGRNIYYTFSIPVLLILGFFVLTYFLFNLNGRLSHIDLYSSLILSITLSLQLSLVLFTPTQFLGRWKGDAYREKLQWEGFKKFLSDLAMIKKYAPEDVVIWKKWLVYGTALGSAKKVEKIMRSLNVNTDEVDINRRVRIRFHRNYTTLTYGMMRLQAAKNAARSPGFGIGGGFGGGGAGGR